VVVYRRAKSSGINNFFAATTTRKPSMRRSALHLGIPLLCALLGVTLVGASGKADDKHQRDAAALPELAMAVTPAPAAFEIAPPATRPSAPNNDAEILITSAPIRLEKPTAMLVQTKPRVVMMEVTAYCACKKCCGPRAQGITASGKRVNVNNGLFVAADKDVFAFNTMLKIPGYASGRAVPVLDRGGAIKGNKLDVFFPSHGDALKWGRQKIAVTVVE
jgi:3D (Asp-Asp-Asp) domain-containing protein